MKRAMAPPPRGIIVSLLVGNLLLNAPASFASAEGAGGVLAEPGKVTKAPTAAGGAEYGAALKRLPARPRVKGLQLTPSRVIAGRRASLMVDVRRPGARTARVAITIDPRRGREMTLGVRRVRQGRYQVVRLPTLKRGSYDVRVTVLGAKGEPPLRSRSLKLVVVRKPRPRHIEQPETAPTLSPSPLAAPAPGAKLGGGVFPVQGSYSFGGDGSRFGAGRVGHLHEGQDIAASEGTPVVAPLDGEILFNDYQARGAGRYVVMHSDNGWDMFFAHLQAGSATLEPGARVSAGTQIGRVGSTGGSSGPHLHFEIWPEGWRQVKGTRPIDPLPQLRRWAG